MQYFRCKCGHHEWWTSMGVAQCARCEKCGSGPGQSPGMHREPVPHDFSLVTKVETDDGEGTLSLCRYCLKSKRHVEKEDAYNKSKEENHGSVHAAGGGGEEGTGQSPEQA